MVVSTVYRQRSTLGISAPVSLRARCAAGWMASPTSSADSSPPPAPLTSFPMSRSWLLFSAAIRRRLVRAKKELILSLGTRLTNADDGGRIGPQRDL